MSKELAPARKAAKRTKKGSGLTPKEWTIMVYMAGDNNLSDEMIRTIIELRDTIGRVGTHIAGTHAPYERNGISILVEFDGQHPVVPERRYDLTFDTKNPNNFPATSGPVKVPVPPTPVPSPGSSPIGNIEERIRNFIQHCFDTQPAKKYVLILSGHSDAFLGRTLLSDQDPSGVATLQGIRQVIEDKFKTHGKLDFLGFDGCVMNSLEVIYEFRDVAKTWIGSQGSIPNYTWDYGRMAEQLMDYNVTLLDENKIADAITTAVKEYNCPFAFGGRSVDISALDLTKVGDFSGQLGFCSGVMALILTNYGPNTMIGSKILQVLLQAHWNCQTSMHDQSVDLIDYLIRVRNECAKLIRLCERINPATPQGAVNEDVFTDEELLALLAAAAETGNLNLTGVLAVMHYGCSYLLTTIQGLVKSGIFVGANYRFCNGISIFLPWSYVALWMSKGEYTKLEFTVNNPEWYGFLEVYTAWTARPTMPLNPAHVAVLNKAFNELLQELIQVLVKAAKTSTKGLFQSLNVITLPLIEELVDRPFGDTKDNPPFNRGLESYLHYFGKTNNIEPRLNIKGDFPPRRELGTCPD